MAARRLKVKEEAAKHRIYSAWLKGREAAHKTRYGDLLPARRIRELGLLDPWRLAKNVAGWLTRHCDGAVITACITNSSSANAWALVDGPSPGESVIVVTKGALLKLQRMNELVAATAATITSSMDAYPVLARALACRKLCQRTAIAIGQLVMTSATVFLLLHETAHIVRGHLRAAASGESGAEPVQAAAADITMPTLPVVSSAKLSERNRYSRTIEVDADVQALYWTRLFLDHADLGQSARGLGDASQEVIELLLSSADGRRWVTLTSAMCFHMALGGSMSTLVGIAGATHPSRHERVELSIISDLAIAFNEKAEPRILNECVTFCIRMICIDYASEKPMLSGSPESSDGADGVFGAIRIDQAARWLGVSVDPSSENLIHKNRLEIMSSMQQLEPSLELQRRVKFTLPPLVWWRLQ